MRITALLALKQLAREQLLSVFGIILYTSNLLSKVQRILIPHI